MTEDASKCLFCDIVQGRVSSHLVREEDQVTAILDPFPIREFQSGIDGLSSWLMRIIKEVGHGAALQAVRERRAR